MASEISPVIGCGWRNYGMPWATSQDIPPAVRYLWPKLFNKLVFEIVSLFIFEGGLYLSYRIIIHYILLYIIHIAVCNIHYLGWLGAPIPRKKKISTISGHHSTTSVKICKSQGHCQHKSQTLSSAHHPSTANYMCFEPRQPNRNITLGIQALKDTIIPNTTTSRSLACEGLEEGDDERRI